jgi:glycosyltransferase involved in cell wall biosynthesis
MAANADLDANAAAATPAAVSLTPEPDNPATPWRGFLEVVKRDWLYGWAQDEANPESRLVLRISDNGVPLGEVVADQYRPDLESAGIGDGHHAFSMNVPGGLSPEIRHLIAVQRADDGRHVNGSPWILDAAVSAATVAATSSAAPAPWRGKLEILTRQRIEGWAWDERTPDAPLGLVVLDNGAVIARVLANRYRRDLSAAGIGAGRHAFAVHIPGGLSPLTRHVIQVIGEADGCEMPTSPAVIEAATGFDPALEQAMSSALSALTTPAERARALEFLATESERLLQQNADDESGLEARLIHRQLLRRWGKARHSGDLADAAAPLRRALVVDDRLPAADQEAGAVAILSHMRALQALGYEVSFVAAEELTPPAGAIAALKTRGIRCCTSPFYASVEEVLRRQKDGFEVIYLHRVSNARKYLALARQYARRARILYSVADLHHVRLARQAQVESRPELQVLSRQLRLAESVAASAADAVITHSLAEAQWLRQSVKGASVHVVPWSVPVRAASAPWSSRHGVAFIGNFDFAPNVDAARILANQIMPQVWGKDPSIECLLVGSRMPTEVTRLANPKILVLGHVPDLATIFERVRLTVAPLRYGAGVKGKVLESFAAGVPCAMSPIAAEGLQLPALLAGTVAGNVQQFAALILSLHGDEARAGAIAEAALAFMGAGFGDATVAEQLGAVIEGRRAPDAPLAQLGAKG